MPWQSVAIKLEAELAALLEGLPNKSAFVRKAILAQLEVPCPLCQGACTMSRGLHDHYAPAVRSHAQRKCAGCDEVLPLPHSQANVSGEDRPRIDQFLRGGPLYCANCYRSAPSCPGCGWHLTADSDMKCPCPSQETSGEPRRGRADHGGDPA